MWIEDLTKALYFLNATEYKYSVCIEKIIDDTIFFSNHKILSVEFLVSAYEDLIRYGKVTELW